jgi:hypothetical protein
MLIFLVLVAVLLSAPLAVLWGADSRVIDDRDRRAWWPASPRS